MSLEDQLQNPLQFFPTSIQEWAFSEVSLRSSGVHNLPTENLGIGKQNQKRHASFYSTKNVALGHDTSWLYQGL